VVWSSANAAEQAFYSAFERGEVDEMMAIWAPSPEVICIHPMGSVLTGLPAIRASWAEILSVQVPRKIDIERIRTVATPQLVLHAVYESMSLPLHRQRFAPIAAINGYRPFEDGWRMVLHHASPVGGIEQPVLAGAELVGNSTRH
jgi:ketosteroid isomerase-like protein